MKRLYHSLFRPYLGFGAWRLLFALCLALAGLAAVGIGSPFAAETGISVPESGASVTGRVTVRGSAQIKGFQRYELYLWPPGPLPQQIWLATVYHTVRDGPLYVWDTTGFPDGTYSLQLRLVTLTADYVDYYANGLYVVNQARAQATAAARATAEYEATLTAPEQTVPETPTATPTATPLQAGDLLTITSPITDTALRGVVTVRGTAHITDQVGYRLDLGLDNGEGFEPLAAVSTTVSDGVLGVWNTRGRPDGTYALRLSAILRGGETVQRLVRGYVTANSVALPAATPAPVLAGPGLYGPRTGQVVRGQVRIWGTASAAQFLRYDLHISPAGSGDWYWLASSSRPVERDTLALWESGGYLPRTYDLRLRVVRQDGNYDEFVMPRIEVQP